MTMRMLISKFPGTCSECKTRFDIGTAILWAPGTPSRHADPKVCGLARHAAHARQLAQTPRAEPVILDAAPILAFLTAAQARGLKFPKARFLAPDGASEMRLSVAGPESKTPGAVHIVIAGEWQARIHTDGRLAGPRVTPALVEALKTIAAAPAIAAKAYAALTSRCSFCHLELTDAGSVAVGYGPVCAEHYGLPHTALGTPKALTAPALAQLAPETLAAKWARECDEDADARGLDRQPGDEPRDEAERVAASFVDDLEPLPF